ncbi:MAG: esterase/lipase family protein [Acidimicrobiales bacterium]
MTDVVLIHGAFRGAWSWDRMRPLLKDAGHRTFAAELTDPAATLSSYINTIANVFEGNGVDNAVLVGHSQGGFIAKAASEVLADRLLRLVHIDAPVPAHGMTAFDFRPPDTDPPPVERGDVIPPRAVEPGAGISIEDAAWINERLVGQPVAPSMDRVRLTNPAALALPETYVFFERTPPGYPCAITRAELDATGTPYTLIDAPHDGIITDPDVVAAALLSAF